LRINIYDYLMTWVKICGTTNLDDAVASSEAGADALGFIFAPSPRQIDRSTAKKIVSQLPPQVEKVGVFVNESADRIREIVAEVGLTAVQLHGDEDAEFIRQLHSGWNRGEAGNIEIIKVLVVNPGFELKANGFADSQVDRFLLDSCSALRGGSGTSFEMSQAADFLRRYPRTIIAGGLDVSSVAGLVKEHRPGGVDVVTGVEREPGRKDHKKVRAFVAAVRQADSPQQQAAISQARP
jgi:phosphoribosylanthranilate isomerase